MSRPKIAEGGQIAEQSAPVVSGALHTPTPWRAARNDHYWEIHGGDHGQIGDVCASKFIYVDGDKLPSYEAELIAEANAAFIVRAVNSHDALVKALEEIRALIDVPGQPLWSDCRAAVDILNAALASAREVQS